MGVGAFQLVSGVAQFYMNMKAAKDQDKVYYENQKALLDAARHRQGEAVLEESQARARTGQLIGEQTVAYASGGVDVGTGTPVDVISNTAALGEMAALLVRSNAAKEAYGLVSAARNVDIERRYNRKRATLSAIGGLVENTGKAYKSLSTDAGEYYLGKNPGKG